MAQSLNPFESFHNLQSTTYGMEIEKYTFYPEDRVKFLEIYKTRIELEQKARVRDQLLLPPSEYSKAACLCTIYRREDGTKKEIMQVRLDGEREFPFFTPDKIATRHILKIIIAIFSLLLLFHIL